MNAPRTIKSELSRAVIPAREGETLLAHILKKSRAFILAHPEAKITQAQAQRYSAFTKRRLKGEPLAYLMGTQPFGGTEFVVNKHVLIPRPETEFLVEYGIKMLHEHPEIKSIVDVGTGSGAILVSALKHLSLTHRKKLSTFGLDASAQALAVARRNGQDLGIIWKKENLLGNLKLKPPTLLLANLPYLTTADYKKTPREVKNFEPKLALVAGTDGLKYYRPLLKQMAQRNAVWFAVFEIDPCHAKTIKALAQSTLPDHTVTLQKDFNNLDRYLIIVPA